MVSIQGLTSLIPTLGGNIIDFLNTIPGVDWWHTQETSGSVALATNSALQFGRTVGLDINPMVAGSNWATDANWAIAAGVATHTAGTADDLTQAGILASGRDWRTIVVVTNRTAGSITIKYGTAAGATRSTNDTFPETVTANGADLVVEATSDFDGNVNFTEIQQANILADTSWPGSELYTTANAASDPNGNEIDGTAGWSTGGSGATIVSQSSVVDVGSFAIQITANDATAEIGQFGFTSVPGCQYTISTRLKAGQGSNQRFQVLGVTVNPDLAVAGDWDTYAVTVIATGSTITVRCFAALSGGDAGDIIYADNISIHQLNPMDGKNTAVAVGQPADGNLGLRYLSDGATTYLDVDSAEHNSKLDPTDFHVLLWMQKDAWDTTERDILSYTVDASNWIRIVDTTTAGTLSFQFRAGGTTEEVTLVTGSPTTDKLVGISVTGGVMKAWYDTGQTGSNQSVAGTFVGNFVTMLIFARTKTPTFVHDGAGTHLGTASRELSASEWADIAARDGV